MDITKTSNEIKSNKIINALTVGYSFFFSVSFFAFLVLKQIMKTGLGIDAKIALPAAAIIASVLLYESGCHDCFCNIGYFELHF